MGPIEIAMFVTFTLIGVALRFRVPTLVLLEYELNPAATADQPVLTIVGRRPGLVAMVMTLCGLQNKTELRVTRDEIECRTSSLRGRELAVIPVGCVASVDGSFRKSLGYLIAAFVLLANAGVTLLAGVFSRQLISSLLVSLVLLVVAGVLALAFFWSKSIHLGFCSSGGSAIVVRFRPGLIEGVPINAETAIDAADAIRSCILGHLRGTSKGNIESTEAGRADGVNKMPIPVAVPLSNDRHVAPEAAGTAWPPDLPRATVAPFQSHEEIESIATAELRAAVERYRQGFESDAAATFRAIASRYSGTQAGKKALELLQKVQRKQ